MLLSPLPAAVAAPGDKPTAAAAPWRGPSEDFRLVEGRIFGPWWQGGGPAVVYYTGPYASRHKSFIDVGQTMAVRLGRPYREIHKQDLQPSADDANGVLAYPDGSARVQLFLMPGGNSFFTMCEIAGISEMSPEKAKAERAKFVEARKVPQQAFRTGMNYVGACGGFFSGDSGYDVKGALYTGWGLWPGKVKNIGPGKSRPFPDVAFDESKRDHPLYKATQNGMLRDMYFNGGPLTAQSGVPDTEYFGKYVGGNMPEIIGDWFCIAYKPAGDGLCGRCVMATGHPEVAHKDFLMAMAEYAVAHSYEVPRRFIEPGKPVEGACGDGQVQYYCVKTEAGRKMTAKLTGMDENCDLYVRHALPPTLERTEMKSARGKSADESLTVSRTRAGEYFIGVHGKHSVLNGAHYTLTVTFE